MTVEDLAEASSKKAKRPAATMRGKKRDAGAEEAPEPPGRAVRERLLAGGGLAPDRVPMLRVLLDEMAAAFEEELRKLSFPAPKFVIESVASARAADAQATQDGCALTSVYGGADADSRVTLAAERRFVFAMVEGLFGADGTEPFYEEDRGLTGLEQRLGRSMLDRLAKALQNAFAARADASVPLDPVEVKPEPAGAARKAGSVLLCRCRLSAFERDSVALIAIPQSVVEPMRAALAQDPSATIQTADPLWAQRMKARVTRTEVTLSAVMEKGDLTLGDIARFEVGQIVELPVTPTGLIKLECEGQALFWCEIGQKDGAYTIRVEDFVDKEQEFIDDVLGA
jgi:flagellar motor switch protein FliM